MSFMNWLSSSLRRARPGPAPARSQAHSGAARAGHASAAAQQRKAERFTRREQLYGVVRETVARAGVPPTGYKFKVLALDGHGRQFLVMVDLFQGVASQTNSLSEIEAMIAQGAKVRHEILVTAVYWRSNGHVALGLQQGGSPVQQVSAAPLAAPAAAAPGAPPPQEPAAQDTEVLAEEMEAFRRARAAGTLVKRPPPSYTLLTGFEDTELSEEVMGDENAHGLGGTQYGELR